MDDILPYYKTNANKNVYPKVDFKAWNCFDYNLTNEIKKLKERKIEKEGEMNNDKANRRLRQIFEEES